jgi:hypothetical protein
MRRIHLAAGLVTVAAFLISGQFIRHHHPPMDTLGDSTRLMFRSRHIYLLASGLVNLMLGLYLHREKGWRGVVQFVAFGFLIASPVFLAIAFATEPAKGFQPEMAWTSAGLYLLFGGSMLHVVSAFGRSTA